METNVPERTPRGRPGERRVATVAGPPPGGQISLEEGWEVRSHASVGLEPEGIQVRFAQVETQPYGPALQRIQLEGPIPADHMAEPVGANRNTIIGGMTGKHTSLGIQEFGSQFTAGIGVHAQRSTRQAQSLGRDCPCPSSRRQEDEPVQAKCGQTDGSLHPLAAFDPTLLYPFQGGPPVRMIPRSVVELDLAVTDGGSVQGDHFRVPRLGFAKRGGLPPRRDPLPLDAVPAGRQLEMRIPALSDPEPIDIVVLVDRRRNTLVVHVFSIGSQHQLRLRPLEKVVAGRPEDGDLRCLTRGSGRIHSDVDDVFSRAGSPLRRGDSHLILVLACRRCDGCVRRQVATRNNVDGVAQDTSAAMIA